MYEKSYETARKLLGFIALVGWVVVGAGAIAVIYALNELGEARGPADFFLLMGLGQGLIGIVSGLVLVAITQVSVAVLDQADISREMLNKMRAGEEAS